VIIADQPYDRDCGIRWVARPILMSHRSGVADSPSRTVDYRTPRGLDPRKSGSHRTLCWRKPDSNHRYRVTPPKVREGLVSPPPDPPRSEKSERTRLDTKTTPGSFRGTDGSNPVPSSSQSVSAANAEAVSEKPHTLRRPAGGWGREKGRASCEPGLLRSFSLTRIDAVPPPESSDRSQRRAAAVGRGLGHICPELRF
jgi:hypothetical protein